MSQSSAVTTITPAFVAPSPTNTSVSRATRYVKSTIRPPSYTLGTPLPTITPSGAALAYLPKSVNALKKRLPASFGILKQSATSIAATNIETFNGEILLELEGPTQAIYVVEMAFFEESNTAYASFNNGRNTIKNGKSVSVGEDALIDPYDQNKIARMRYRNVVVAIYANNSPVFGDPTATSVPLTESQLIEVLRTIEKALKAELILQGQSQ